MAEKLTLPLISKSTQIISYPHAFVIGSTKYPNVNGGYGPYEDKDIAKAALIKFFGESTIPDGVQTVIYDDTNYMQLYLWFNGDFHEIGTGGGSDSTVNVQSQYVVGSTNLVITIPTDSEGKCTNAVLKEVSETTITVNNGSIEFFELDTDVNIYDLSGNAVYKVVKDSSSTTSDSLSIKIHYEFLDGATEGTPIEGTMYFNLSFMGTVAHFYQYVKLQKDQIVYAIKPTTGVLSINDRVSSTEISQVILDIDGYSARDSSDITLNEDDIEVYYWNSKGASASASKYPIDFTLTGSVLTFDGNSGITTPDGEETTIQALVVKDLFRTGEQIIVKAGEAEWQYVTIVRSKDISGKFVTPYAFELSKDNVTIPESLKGTLVTSLQYRTKTRFLYRDEDNELQSAYLSKIEFSGLTSSDINIFLIKEDNTEVAYASASISVDDGTFTDNYIAYYSNKISEDGALTFVMRAPEDSTIIGEKSQSISFIDAGDDAAGYYLEVYPQVVGKLLKGSSYKATNDVYLRVHKYSGSDDSIVGDEDWGTEGVTVARILNGTTSNLTADLDEITGLTTSLVDTNTITYELTVTKNSVAYVWARESVTLINDTKSYDVDFGNNNAIIIDDDSDDAAIRTASMSFAKLVDNGEEVDYTKCTITLSGVFTNILELYAFEANTTIGSGSTITVTSSETTIYLRRYSAYSGTTKLPGTTGLITYIFTTTNGTKTVYQSVKILDISDGTNYRLNVTPSVVPLNVDGTLSLLSNKETQTFNISYTKCSGENDTTEVLNANTRVLSSEPSSPTKGDLCIIGSMGAGKTFTCTDIQNSSALTFTLKLYNGSSWNTVDTETIGYTLVGATGSAVGSIQMTNDSAVIDDSSIEDVLETVTLNSCTFLVGNKTIDNVKWKVSINGDISTYCEVYNGNTKLTSTSEITATTFETSLHFKSTYLSSGTGAAAYGYIKYTAECSDGDRTYTGTKVLSIRISDISLGSSYKLVVWPNTLQVDSEGNCETQSFKFKLQEITKDSKGINPSGIDLADYNIAFSTVGGTRLYNFSPVSDDSYTYTLGITTAIYNKCKDGLIVSILKDRLELSSVTFTYNGATYTGRKDNALSVGKKLVNCYYGSKVKDLYLGLVVLQGINVSESDTFALTGDELYITLSSSIPILNSATTTYFIEDEQITCYTIDGKKAIDFNSLTVDDIYCPELEILDSETIGIAKAGEAAASNGLSITIDNDSFLLDNDSTDNAITGASKIIPTVYYNGSKLTGAYSETSGSYNFTYTLTLYLYNESGTRITTQLAVDTTNSCLKRITNYTNALTEGYGYIECAVTTTPTFNTANGLSSSLSGNKKSNFFIEDFNEGQTYRIIASPNVISREVDSTKITVYAAEYSSNLEESGDGIATLTTTTPSSTATQNAGNIYLRYYLSSDDTPNYKYSYDTNVGSVTNNKWTVTLTKNTSAVGYIFELVTYSKKGNIFVLDSETIDFNTKGDSGLSGGIYRYIGEWNDLPTTGTFCDGSFADTTTGYYYIDVVKYSTSNVVTFFECIKTHSYANKGSYKPDEASSYWREYEAYEGLVTHTLLVYDTDKNVTGGFTGGTSKSDEDVVIWAGANSTNNFAANEANFYVVENGEVHAKKFIGQGTFTLGYLLIDYDNAPDYFRIVSSDEYKYLHCPQLLGGSGNIVILNALDVPETVVLTRGFNKWIHDQLSSTKSSTESITVDLYLPYAIVKSPDSNSLTYDSAGRPMWVKDESYLGYVRYSEDDSIYSYPGLNNKHLTIINGSTYISDPSGKVNDTKDSLTELAIKVYYGMKLFKDVTITDDSADVDRENYYYVEPSLANSSVVDLSDGLTLLLIFGPYSTRIMKDSVYSGTYCLEYCWKPYPVIEFTPFVLDELWLDFES